MWKYWTFAPSKNFSIFFCMYKMYLISAEWYKNKGIGFKKIRKNGETWTSMKDVRSGMGVKNISELVLKEIHSILNTKNTTKEQIKKYKMTERGIFKEFGNLSNKELNISSFYEHHKEKTKVDKNGCKYKLFTNDVYFTEYFLAVEIDEQNHEGR